VRLLPSEIVHELPDGGRGISGKPYATMGGRDAIYLFSRNPHDGGYHGILDRSGTEIAVEWALLCIFRVGTAHRLCSFPRRPRTRIIG
jgi:hypothetical protein